MIISSHRHTNADIALWRELEAADLIHGATEHMRRKVEAAVDEVKRFAADGPCYVGLSGGKDSACVASILDAAGLLASVPAVWFRAVPKYSPDVPQVLARLNGRFPNLQLEVIGYDSPVPCQMTRLEAEEIARKNFDRVCRDAERRWGRRILGIRADESRQRLIRFCRWGLSTKSSCGPIGRWSLADVYGYIAVGRIPIHPAYAMLGGGRWQRHKLRIDALMGERGDGSGRNEWEREYYGDEIRRLEAVVASGCAATAKNRVDLHGMPSSRKQHHGA